MDRADAGGKARSRGEAPSNGYGADLREGFKPPRRRTRAQPAASLPSGGPFRQLSFPVLLMNLPLSLSASIPNNAYMDDLRPSEREIRLDRALAQFRALYEHIARRAVVYLLPSTPGFQDQTYVSNLGVVLPHRGEDTVIISRFRSRPRVGEERTGAKFFDLMNFKVEQPPATFAGEPVYLEGEADLKHIRGNLYVGAHAMRTSRSGLSWAAERFDMKIIPFRIADPYLYHLDCCLFRMTEDAVLLCTSVADRASLRALERHCEIIDISLQHTRAGITNGLLLPNEILCDSPVATLRRGSESYAVEKSKIERLEEIGARFGRAVRLFCMSEFYKSGALLSCLVMHIRQVTDVSCERAPEPPALEGAREQPALSDRTEPEPRR
jgi:N-dimethylarginine dimethylaminohydrolase